MGVFLASYFGIFQVKGLFVADNWELYFWAKVTIHILAGYLWKAKPHILQHESTYVEQYKIFLRYRDYLMDGIECRNSRNARIPCVKGRLSQDWKKRQWADTSRYMRSGWFAISAEWTSFLQIHRQWLRLVPVYLFLTSLQLLIASLSHEYVLLKLILVARVSPWTMRCYDL